ncbi:protein, SNF2 family [Cooperia oncophora]
MESVSATPSQNVAVSVDEYLERIYLRFAMTESDEQLQKFTDAYLVRLIETANTEPNALTKIREILSHYNRRAKAVTSIRYPVEALLGLVKEKGLVATNLSLVYLRFASGNLSEEERLRLLPLYFEVLSCKVNETIHCAELLSLCVPAFMILTQKEKHLWPKLVLSENVKLLLLRFLFCIIAFPIDPPDVIKSTCTALTNGEKIATPAITADEYLMIAGKVFTKDVTLVPIKLCALKLLTSGLFDDAAIFSILALASAQNVDAVTDAAEAALKKIDIQACVDNRAVVDELMAIYLGMTMVTKTVMGKSTTPSPANSLMKQKILQYLTRSTIAPVTYMNNMKICLDGLTLTSYTKLLVAALNFLHKVIEKMPAAAQKNFSALLFDRIQKVREETKNGNALSLIYRCMGIIGKRDPSIVTRQVETIPLTFKEIAKSPDDVAYAVVDCLTQWLEGFRKLTDQSLDVKLKLLIQEFLTHENSKCRLIALKYMEAFLTSADFDLRWMLLLACGDNRDEIRGEASRLLDVSLKVDVPAEAVVLYLWECLKGDIVDPKTGKEKSPSSQVISPLVHQMSTRYIWAVMAKAAGVHTELKTVDSGHEWKQIAPKIAQHVKKLCFFCQECMTEISLHALKEAQEVPLFHIATCFSAVYPPKNPPLSLLMSFIQRTRGTTRSDLANVAAHLAASLLNSKERETMFPAAVSALERTNVTAGDCWLASAFIASHATPRSSVLSVINQLVNIAEEGYNKPNNVLESALGSLANILRTILFHDKDFELPTDVMERLLSVCEKIATSRKDAVSTKAHEEATYAIGFCATTMDSSVYEKLSAVLYSIGSGPPQPEVQLVVGSALFDVALGPYSTSRRNLYITLEEDFQLNSLSSEMQELCEKRLAQIFSKIFDEKLSSMSHHERRSALIWLLIVVRRSFKARACLLQGMLDKIQTGFGIGLAENDDFTQDVASSGIGLVYEMASEEQRKALVNDLISRISEGKPFSTTKVDSNTEIFNKEQQITGPDGQHLTTYKELCSLATDLNQPDLVYKFMNLARHNSVWNLKKGAALGFAAVLEEASNEFEPFIGQLVPKLFRYRYDPDLKVRQSMRSIWSVLTASRRGLVEEYADDIAKELQQQLTSPEWRVRESACLALSDLIQGNDSRYIRSITPSLMLTIFRLRDDVKESVRQSANRAINTLGKLAVRLSSESPKGHDPRVFISSLLPVLIQNGIHSEIKVNKQFSISLLLELSKTAGSQLRPHLAELIPSLIDTISDTEPAILNYVAARSTLDELEMLDDARAKMARTSPMMTAIQDLLPQIDSAVLIAIQPRLCEQLRSSAGASTRIACAQLLTMLALRAAQLLGDHQTQCDKFFNALISGTRDRNPSVRKHFASAVSYMAKYASPSSFEALMRTVLKDLLADDESMKQSAKHVLKNLSANCPELLQGYSKLVVPYIFMETCQHVVRGDETSKKRQEEWCDLWNEIVPSTEAAVRMYREEIISFILDILRNNDVWSVRAQAARMLTETTKHLQERLEGADAASLLSSLLPMLSGRIWPGKEDLLSAVGTIFSCAGPSLRKMWSDKEVEEVFAVMSREASKRKKEYSSAGLLTCALFSRSLPYPQGAQWLLQKVGENVQKALDPSKDDDQSDEELSGASTKETKVVEFVSQNMAALAKAVGAFSEGKNAAPAVDALCSYLTSPGLFWKAKQTLSVSLLELIESWQLQSPIEATQLVDSLLTMAEEMIGQQRKSIAMQCIAVISKITQRQESFAVQWDEIKSKWETSQVIQETNLFTDLASPNLGAINEVKHCGMSSSKFSDGSKPRVAHRSSAASDEVLQSLEHKRLALAKIAASIGGKKVAKGPTVVKHFANGVAHHGPDVKKKKIIHSDDDEDFIVSDEVEDADEEFMLSDEEEKRPRKKKKTGLQAWLKEAPKKSASGVLNDSATNALGLGRSGASEKVRTLSESSEEEWLCKPRIDEEAKRMKTRVSDSPVKKRSRIKAVLSDESDDDEEEKLTSAPTLKKVAKAAAKHGRKRKRSSDEEYLDDGSEKGSYRGGHSSEEASSDSDDEEHHSRNEGEDHMMQECVEFFNTATRPQLSATPRMTEKIISKIVDRRPFKSFAEMEAAFAEIPRATGALDAYMEFLENRGVLEKILDDCKDHAASVAAEFERCTNRRIKPSLLDEKCSLHEYQLVGLNWLVMMHEKGFNCILGDEMGLGKTIQVIAFIAYLMEANVRGPHLIVVPSSTIENWMAEFIKWCPKVRLLTYYGSQEERRQLRHMAKKKKENIDVILTTYNMISSKHDDKKFFKNFSIHYVVYDEGHMLKNCGTDRYRNLMKVRGKRKVLMTGTPLQNNLIELISLMYFVMTHIFTKYCEDIAQLLQHFKQQGPALESGSCSMYQKDRIEQAKQILQPYMLRRLKAQVLYHLPEKHEEVIEVEMLENQKELYENVLESVRGVDGDTNNAYGALMRLRQAANHPLLRRTQYTDSLLDKMAKTLCAKEKPYEKKRWEDVAEDLSYQSDFQIHQICERFRSTKKYLLCEDLALESGKCQVLDKLLPKIKSKGDKVLIFSQFTSMLDILEVYLRIRQFSFRRLDGSTPVMERQEMINEFNNDPDLCVFLLSTRAGGLGINLTSANHIILHDIDFNPYNDKQAEDRCHRMGQEKEVYVTKLVSKDTVEVDIHCLARKKLQLEKAVTDGIKGQLDENDEVSRGSGDSKEEKPDSDTLCLLLNSALKRKSSGDNV